MFSNQSLRRWAVAGTLSLLAGCGPEAVEQKQVQVQASEQEIVGGTNTTIEANPWQVSLQSSSGSHFCGGSIINESWILTAQHCVNDGGAISTPGRVVAGITTRSSSSTGQIRSVAQVVVYPGYVDASKGKDIALLRLSTPLDLSGTKVKAIGITTAAEGSAGFPAVGAVARVTGWGTLTSGGSTLPDTLQTVDVNIVSNSSAQSSYPNETITADQLAAAAPGKDSCQGDSGGPLTVLRSDGTRVLAGIVSWGYGCADSRYPGMYARVSSYESWINTTISGGGSGGGTPTTDTKSGSVASGAWSPTYSYSVVAGSQFKVTMTGTGDPDLYVRWGSAPTTTSYNCRPYLSGASESCTLTVPAGTTSAHVAVRGYTSATYNLTINYTKP